MNDFDFIAHFYDRLARWVFGDQILKSQICFLSEIKSSDRVLVLGGGSGKILEFIPGCHCVHYVEKSGKMVDMAKKRMCISPIHFLPQDFFDFQINIEYDVIICPFFLDCFNHASLKLAIGKISTLLKSDGRLIVTDFQKKNTFLIGLMHIFFKLFSRLESNGLKDIDAMIVSKFFEVKLEEFFFKKMIFSRAYTNVVEKS